ncbi:MAG: DUF935 domain-containing protein [Aquabacterium sp.]
MKILDHNGDPIDTGRLAEPQTAHVGHLAREFERHPSRGLTPARLHALMSAAEQGDLLQQLDLAEDMEERDGHLYAELDKRRGAVAALPWSIVEPEGADAGAKRLAAQLREWLQGIDDFEDLVRGLMDAVLKSFSCHEMVWELRDGVRLPRIELRPARWFTVDRETRSELRLRTMSAAEGEPLRPFSWIAHRHRTRNGYLARGGLVRVLAWPYLFKNYAVRDLAEFLEIYGLPLRLGKYPAGASDDEKRRLLAAVSQIGHNAAGIVPQSMAIEFEAAAQGTDAPFLSMVRMMDAVQSKAILGQTLTASEGEHGTQALGNVHNEVRMDIRNSDARQVEATLNRQLLWPMAALNVAGADPRRMPRLQLDTTEAEDLAAFAEHLPKLAASGLRIPVKWTQDKLRIPEPEGDEPVMQGPQAAPAPGDEELQPGAAKPAAGGSKKPPGKPAALAAEPRGTEQIALMDQLVAEALADWELLLEPLVQPLLAEIEAQLAAGQTLAGLRDHLPQLLARMDARPAAERLARAAFMARLAGAADLDVYGSGGSGGTGGGTGEA